LADAALVAAGGVGVGVVAHFYREVLAYELLGIEVFAFLGLDAYGRVERENDGVAGRRVVKALGYETILIFHVGGKKGHLLVLAHAFFDAGDGNEVAAIGQETLVLAFVNGNFHRKGKIKAIS